MKNQPFDYFVVLDFEATCDNVDPPEPQEIIEYPSVLLCGSTFNVLDEFSSFVRPIHHPELSSFCMELTGISQVQVDGAPPFPEVFERHQSWLRGHDLQVSTDEAGYGFAFILCGDWDFGTMLPVQFQAADPPVRFVPRAFRQWINMKKIYAECLGKTKAPGMAGMLRQLGLELKGRHHRGIDDCRNIARIVQTLADRGAAMKITTELSTSTYPQITIVLRHGEETRQIELHRRSLKTLLGLTCGTFERQVEQIFDKDGNELTEDTDLLDLADWMELTVG